MASRSSRGTPFGRYRLLERLGRGGVAEVHRAALDGPEGFSRLLVIKRVLPELARTPEFVKMLASEARLSARLRHPNIVQVFEFGEVDGRCFLAMELVDGWDLRSVRRALGRDGAFPIGIACFVAVELASALAYAHGFLDEGIPREIIHRDVNPANVMITREGAVKLLDFGIAKAVSEVPNERTRTGVLKGTLGYMSPEQVSDVPLDRRSDQFALGVLFYELLTGVRAFDIKGGPEDVFRRIREARLAPPSSIRPEVDAELDAIVLKMLARDREDRYPSLDEAKAALRPIVRRLGTDAAALGRFVAERMPERDAPTDDERSVSGPRPKTARFVRPSKGRFRGVALLALAAVLAAGVGRAAMWLIQGLR